MKTPDENRLDRLFREGLTNPEENEAAFREEDWAAMEKLLEEERPRRRGLVWLCLISGSIAAVFLLVWLNPFPGLVKRSEKQETLKITGNRIERSEKQRNPEFSENHETDASGRERPEPDELSGENGKTASPNTGGVLNGAANSTKENKKPVPETGPYRGNANGTHKSVAASAAGEKMTDGAAIEIAANTDRRDLPESTELSDGIDTAAAGRTREEAAVALQRASADGISPADARDKSRPERSVTGISRVSLSVLAAPDVNGVNSFNGQVGTNIGMLVSVKLGNKWSLSTGAVYAFKPYDLRDRQLSGNYNYVSRAVTGVTANCRVLDVPLNIGYRLFTAGKNTISVGTGLSSYFMLREKYTFLYADQPNWGYEVSNRNKHIAGVLNLNAVYQRQLNGPLSFMIQPYLKIPLTPIGNENIDLRSAGIAFGVGWNIHSRNKEKQ